MYISARKKVVPVKTIKNTKDCMKNCYLKYAEKLTNEERKSIFKDYYSLENVAENRMFILGTTKQVKSDRRKEDKNKHNSRRRETKRVITIYSTPGHSAVQEIDAAHSSIERTLGKTEYFSPISLIRLHLSMNKKRPYKIVQMRGSDFFNLYNQSQNLNYSAIPYSQVKTILYKKKYETSYLQQSYFTVNIRKTKRRPKEENTLITNNVFRKCEISKEKLSCLLPK
ncbi:hypothetical protein ILUMI_20600 [Ignelater luminosus]|uniref:Uncharacterized protein n=1 Tax=Ignelater luminosus TaxID=2038154 RepID=A0A8K0CKE0_IGNLU|nr:hypothetical protein ILUMI_20600 [Ignelater luminosus]